MEKKTANKSGGMSTQNKVMMGAGIAALAAATAGAIFLYGTDAGKKKRKQIKSWSLKMQADVIDKMESMKEWSEEAYNAVVDQVADKYKTLKNVDAEEVAILVADLRKHWKSIKRQVEGGGKKKRPAKKKQAANKTTTE
jgi:hypothetical protein